MNISMNMLKGIIIIMTEVMMEHLPALKRRAGMEKVYFPRR